MNIEHWSVERLVPYEKNAKKHTPEQIADIAKLISKGWDQPIVVDEHGVIIKGHGRRLAAMHLKLKTVPVLVREGLSENEVKALRLSDNRVAIADFDPALLRVEMASLDKDLLTGFSTKEIDFALADLGSMTDGSLIDNLDTAVNDLKNDQTTKGVELAAALVPIADVLGFKKVTGANVIFYTRFMAMMEAETGLKGEEAMSTYVKKMFG